LSDCRTRDDSEIVTPPIPDQVPTIFSAGETLKFRRNFNDYSPADGWQYKIFFNGPDVFQGVGVVDPDNSGGWLITVTADQTAVDAGVYKFVERVISPINDVHQVGQGVVTIELDFATAPANATLSFAEQALAAVEAELLVRITGDVEEYSVQASTLGGGRSVKKIPTLQLQKLRGFYASMVWRKKNPGKVGAPVFVDFVDESNDANFPSTWVDVTGLPGAGQ
jgi:hypothetical protein